MKRVLQLATYDISDPKSGGAIRAYHIAESLRRDFLVYTLVFGLKDLHSRVTWQDDPDFNRRFGSRINIDFETCMSRLHSPGEKGCLMDWGISNYVLGEAGLVKALGRMIKNIDPDIILLEQPFLWPIVDLMKRERALKSDCCMIYSSHNTEAPMKREIYAHAFPEDICHQHLSYVESLEQDSVMAADLVIATCDAESFFVKGIDSGKKVLVKANGHTYRPRDNLWWKDKFQASGCDQNWVYVSSAHPPNVNGLKSLLDLIPKSQTDFKIWLLGSIGQVIGCERYPFVECHHEISNQDIDDAISCADGVILPIWQGGGTNLKTAQALLSGKPIVSTAFAFRGFENYINQEGVRIAESSQDMADILKEKPSMLSPARTGTNALDFAEIMRSLPDEIKESLWNT